MTAMPESAASYLPEITESPELQFESGGSTLASTNTTATTSTALATTAAPTPTGQADAVATWQASAAAAQYAGRWVALDEQTGRVLAAADSPSGLNAERTPGVVLVFVRPAGRWVV